MDKAIEAIATQGILGALLVVAMVAIYYLYKSLREVEAGRLADSVKTLELAMKMQSSIIDAVHKLGDLIEWAEKREDRREESASRRP